MTQTVDSPKSSKSQNGHFGKRRRRRHCLGWISRHKGNFACCFGQKEDLKIYLEGKYDRWEIRKVLKIKPFKVLENAEI